ncbi:MAG: 6-pyruvoyl tetrahydropterin synthase family protein [Leptospira sp.]|nr:6-pyruvoyl tetrahydropterin synthase family protein [Leptospira sp.]
MIVRKKFSFEGSHIVRNCSSKRCKYSIHGHSYILEIFLTANRLDSGMMIYDFGLLKSFVKEFVDSFDHAIVFWDKDYESYSEFVKENSDRWISLPISPSAEMLSLTFLKAIDFILSRTIKTNGEGDVKVSSVRIHETATGYAESFQEDLYNENFPSIDLSKIIFSEEIRNDWKDPDLWENLVHHNIMIRNPEVEIQVLQD